MCSLIERMYSEFGSPETHWLGLRALSGGLGAGTADGGSGEGGAGESVARARDVRLSDAASLTVDIPMPVIVSGLPRRRNCLFCAFRPRCMTVTSPATYLS